MSYYGQFQPPVDQLIDSYFPRGFAGVAVDVGAVDGVYINNTLHFEQAGWKVLCIEANPIYREALRRNRAYVMNVAVGARDADDVDFHVVKLVEQNDYSSISALSIDQPLLDLHRKMGFTTEQSIARVAVRTLDRCLTEAGFDRVDFVSIDTEGTELDVIRGFDLERWKPRLLVVESNSAEQSAQVTDYLRDRAYRLDKRVEVNDFYVRNLPPAD